MTTTPALVAAGLDALTALLPRPASTPSSQGPAAGTGVDALRVLAVLVPLIREVLDRAAAEVTTSPVRAAALLQLTESMYRQAGYGQLLAASRGADAQLHTIAEEPLAALNELLREPTSFAAGAELPDDATTKPGCKPLYRDTTDFVADALNLTHFQAQHRVQSAENLLPHTGFNGRTIAPKFPLLGQVLSDGAADPKALATLATKFENLFPDGTGSPDALRKARELETELAEAARTRNAQGTTKLLKDQARRLDEDAAARREETEDLFVGAYFLGHTRKGYEYKVITTAEGHELLATAADILNSPRTKAGTTPGSTGPDAAPEPAQIPEWAVDPGTAPEQRPVAGFTDLGQPVELDPSIELRPGENIEQALTRQRARRLHQLILDSVRITTSPAEPGADEGSGQNEQLPLAPNVTLNVTIDLATFLGQLDAAGISDRGEEISAASCRRLACNAGITPIILSGTGVPLDLGRSRRYFNRAQRRAIAVRDKGCINPGCTMRIGRCEAHHLDEWNSGGLTNVSRGCMLCPACHQGYHSGKFRIVMIGGHPHVILPKSRDPLQLPRRNWMFHPSAAPAEAA